MSQNPGLPADRPLETIPPRMVSTPSSMDDLTEQAQEFERYILKHRRDATLEGVLSTALVGQPSFEVACKRLGEPQGKLPALKRLRADLANGRPFAAYMEWLEKKVVVKKPALAPQQLAPAKPVSDRPPALKSTPGPRSKRRRRKVTGKAITVGVVHSPLKAKGTRSNPGTYFVPPIEHACDYCVSQGLSYKCLYPNSKAPVCIIYQASLGPPQTNSGASVPSLCAAIDAQDTALQAELEQVASRLRSVQDIISAIDGSDDVIPCTHLEFTNAVTNLLSVLTESGDLINRFAECLL
ncbi:hypothetical protein FA13DRAFT_1807196 [Coprinellus micaceus]|uniref:Uncharacterized protein n=1 Tax=Coprinellus micaceus TaxID=71717 RepID=A0A4Y7RC69_COPMI|nr:hypothetical protein FA13DRAFT_1807196 [Coprinellus micaceus]